jgi:hypothetical protein
VARALGGIWPRYLLTGVVLLALLSGLPRTPEDTISAQGAASLYLESGAAPDMGSASAPLEVLPAPGEPARMLSSSEGNSPASGALSALLTRQVANDDPEAIFTTDAPALNAARDEAFAVLARDLLLQNGSVTHSAGPGYDAPWIRDSFAWGMIPNDAYPQLAPYTDSELRFWLNQQLPSGQWVSNAQSGYYDETAIVISAALDAYRVTGNRTLLVEALPRLRRGWAWLRGNANGRESTYLLWTPPAAGPQRLVLPVAVDWADQIARRNYPAQLNLLWFRATQSMSVVEDVLGNAGEARRYSAFASGIRADFNRLLWSNGAIRSRNAPPVAPFGHYRSWYPGERDYFELDTNFQAIIYGLADAARTASILSFVAAHETYLLGGAPGSGAPPAKTVYGDYEPADYAQVRNKIGDGLYHNAYWPSIGSLGALAYEHAGQTEMLGRVLDGLAAVFRAGQAAGSASEWYDGSGLPAGASSYQWTARSFIIALYHGYLGVDDDWSGTKAENLRLFAPGGEAIGRLRHLGKWLTVHSHGRGRVDHVLVDGQMAKVPSLIPESLLHDGTVIDVYVDGG